jgi:hypothetical protein
MTYMSIAIASTQPYTLPQKDGFFPYEKPSDGDLSFRIVRAWKLGSRDLKSIEPCLALYHDDRQPSKPMAANECSDEWCLSQFKVPSGLQICPQTHT